MKVEIDHLYGNVYKLDLTVNDTELTDEDAHKLVELKNKHKKVYIKIFERIGESTLELINVY